MTGSILNKLPILKQYQFKWVLGIALCWTFIDFIRFFIFSFIENRNEYPFINTTPALGLLRVLFVFFASLLMAYLMVVRFKKMFRNIASWLGLILKTLVLYLITLLLYTLMFFCTYLLVYHFSMHETMDNYYNYFSHNYYILNHSETWVLLFIITQVLVEVNEKYSPGLFKDILLGKYIVPKEEKKIIMFIDLKDSTSIAETLGHKKYFHFIKDFIYHVSIAVLKCGGDIYQYVGDEVVVSWPFSEENSSRCIQALLQARKELQKENSYYREKYGLIPDFRAGVHTGDVMVGEIGVVKKDLAMSGDPMNTTARIKNVSAELNKKFIVSKDFVDAANLKDFQAESAGVIDLKGKEAGLELFFLNL
ncbi:MAG: adenylate/guanylate cyclase domain-containing protein [Ferruginibacter sp.]